MHPTSEEIKQMMDTIIREFQSVRTLLLENAGTISDISYKKDDSPVTNLDIEIERRVTASMQSSFPDFPVYGEETGYESSDLSKSCWLIDPIDGTESFIKNIPTFTCMAVLIVNSQPVACVIYNPTEDVVYTAITGEGAYKNGVALQLHNKTMSSEALCKGRNIEVLNKIIEPFGIHCNIGQVGAGFGFTQVADGIAAARFQINGNGQVHDYATGALLVMESGGVIIPLDNKPYTCETRSFIACHPDLAQVLTQNLEAIQRLQDKITT